MNDALEHMRVLFEGTPNGLVITDTHGVVLVVNPAFTRMVCTGGEGAVGRPFLDFVADADRAGEAALLQDMRSLRRSGGVRQTALRHANGTEQVMLLTSLPLHDPDGSDLRFMVRIEDIADRQRAEVELLESQSAVDAIVTVDHQQRIVSWNSGAERLLGRPRNDALGQHLSILVPPAMRDAHNRGFARLVGGGEPVLLGKTLELEAATATGSMLPIELTLSRWYRGDEPFFTAVLRDISERRRHEAEQLWHSTHDATTGLGNLSALRHWFAAHCDVSGDQPRAVFSLHLTSLNEVTTALGADVAEQLLRNIGASFQAACADDVEICHLGDSHFAGAALLEGDPHPSSVGERLHAIARYVIDAATGPFQVDDLPIEVHAQVGVVATRQSDVTFSEMLRQAEATRISSPRRINTATELVAHAGVGSDEMIMLSELRAGIERGELELHYQPLVSLQPNRDLGGRPVLRSVRRPAQSVEALVRWRHPTRGLVPPGEFIPLIETGPLISAVTRWVLAAALAQQRRWHAQGLDVAVAVNLSPQVLLNDDVVSLVTTALERSGANPTKLKVEITESAIVADPDEVRDIVTSLRQLGVTVSLDDFGTGYTSLRLLRDLPVDEIKLDRLFVAHATTNPADAAIANAVAQLAQRIGIRTVAEGVEDNETRSLFRALGYDYLQGFVESRPLPVDAATDWLRAAGGLDEAQLPSLSA